MGDRPSSPSGYTRLPVTPRVDPVLLRWAKTNKLAIGPILEGELLRLYAESRGETVDEAIAFLKQC